MYCKEIITIWTYVVRKYYSKFVKIGILVRSLNFFKSLLILYYIYIYIYIYTIFALFKLDHFELVTVKL